jgi:hypothetical protein
VEAVEVRRHLVQVQPTLYTQLARLQHNLAKETILVLPTDLVTKEEITLLVLSEEEVVAERVQLVETLLVVMVQVMVETG